MKYYKVLFLCASLILFLCTGCSGQVKSESEVKQYAKDTFGKVKYVSKDVEDESSVRYIFKDKDRGFSFEVTSSLKEMRVDGSYFGKIESTSNNYLEKFNEHYEQTISSLAQKYNIHMELGETYRKWDTIYIQSFADLQNVSHFIAEINDVYVFSDCDISKEAFIFIKMDSLGTGKERTIIDQIDYTSDGKSLDPIEIYDRLVASYITYLEEGLITDD